MAWCQDAYRELQDIVGPENISDDPVLCDSYAFQWLAELVRPGMSHFMPRPVAAIVPATVEEVQGVVKTCNKYKVKVKPYSTGWYHYCAPQKDGDDTVQLDMRRMNRILEIDEKNMFAVIEPYVSCAQMQAEAMKVGLNCNIIGAGASTSILASATSYAGVGPNTWWMGANGENLLGAEWVMPNGEITRTGSAGSGLGWWHSEGPGPSVRALVRGAAGARGGMGVYTKIGIKLSHWPGPSKLEIEGTVPSYRSPMPANFRAYIIQVDSWDACWQLYNRIYDNDIGYTWHRQFSFQGTDLGPAFWMMYRDPHHTLSDLPEWEAKPEIQKMRTETDKSFSLILAGNTMKDIEYQDRVLDILLEEVGAHKVESWLEPELRDWHYLYLTRMGHKALNFSYNGGYTGTYFVMGVPELTNKYYYVAREQLYAEQKSGLLVQCGGDSMMGPGAAQGGGGQMGLELFVFYDPNDQDSRMAARNHMIAASENLAKLGLPKGKGEMYLEVGYPDEKIWERMAKLPQPARYQRKIKDVIDPNDVGDRMYDWLPHDYKGPGQL